jgi:hypothetical protein
MALLIHRVEILKPQSNRREEAITLLPRGNLAIMSAGKRKNKQKAKPKVAKLRNMLTPRQSRFAKALMDRKVKSRTQAAIIAGYSPKNARQSANQAFSQILSKGPEAMQEAGLSLPVMIDKYLRLLLEAKDTKLAQFEGQYTDFVELEDNRTRLGAVRMSFELLGAFPAEDPALNSKTSVDVIIADMPRPNYDVVAVDVGPAPRELVADPQEPLKPAPDSLLARPASNATQGEVKTSGSQGPGRGLRSSFQNGLSSGSSRRINKARPSEA